jgi:L-ascorbate metabolism protein UlaG (beta-lactamase superfamily)
MKKEEAYDKAKEKLDFLEWTIKKRKSRYSYTPGRDRILKFLVARQWNSWYPSYFASEGGCYAISTRDWKADLKKNNGVIVIDPGFGFLTSLRKLFLIEPQDIRTIIVTHFHPDHMAGLIEFATLTYESEFPCRLFLNETCYDFFRAFQGKHLHIHEIRPGQRKQLFCYKNNEIEESALLNVIETHHSEIGHKHKALGLKIDFKHINNNNEIHQKIGILGDTDANFNYLPTYVNEFEDVDVLVLHIGTLEDRKKFAIGDTHLYLAGIENFLKLLNSSSKIQCVLISEFGLELGTNCDIVKLFSPLIESYGYFKLLELNKIFDSGEMNIKKEIYSDLVAKVFYKLNEKLLFGIKDEELEQIIFIFALFFCSSNKSSILTKEDFHAIDIKSLPQSLKSCKNYDLMKANTMKFFWQIFGNTSYNTEKLNKIINESMKGLLEKVKNHTPLKSFQEKFNDTYSSSKYNELIFSDIEVNALSILSEQKNFKEYEMDKTKLKLDDFFIKHQIKGELKDLMNNFEKTKEIKNFDDSITKRIKVSDILLYAAIEIVLIYESTINPPKYVNLQDNDNLVEWIDTYFKNKTNVKNIHCANAGSYINLFWPTDNDPMRYEMQFFDHKGEKTSIIP